MLAPEPFRVQETHGILSRPENKIRASSDRFGWSSLYASAQREIPYEGYFPAVRDQLIVMHFDGPVPIDRLHGPNPSRCIVPAGGLHLVPGGLDFGVRLNRCLERAGRSIAGWGLSSAQGRWGSCTSQGRIRLNWRLIHFAPALIDYVIAHEVAHLKEMNHGPAFWREVERLCPDFRAARDTLRRQPPDTLPLI